MKKLEYHRPLPRSRRSTEVNHCALSDCCGAPILYGGICFDCHEICEEEDPASRSLGRTVISDEDLAAFASIESPALSFCEEDDSGFCEGVAMTFDTDRLEEK